MKDVFALLDRLEEDAAWYEALGDPASEFWLDYEGASDQVRVLNLFGVSQYLPLVLAAKDMFQTPREKVEILRYCVVISVRFNGVSRRSTHLLEEVYNRAALGLRGGGTPTLASVRETLRPVYIPDEEFEADFSVLRLKKRGISGKRLRYFLAKLEKQLGGTDVSDATMSATVEHILPENPGETGWEQFSEEARERCCERLGNYSLLERGLNGPEAANFAFAEKQKAYAKSQYATSQKLLEVEEWSEEAIAHRQKAMAKAAKTIWALDL
jgi:hypothetical protein